MFFLRTFQFGNFVNVPQSAGGIRPLNIRRPVQGYNQQLFGISYAVELQGFRIEQETMIHITLSRTGLEERRTQVEERKTIQTNLVIRIQSLFADYVCSRVVSFSGQLTFPGMKYNSDENPCNPRLYPRPGIIR